MRIIQTPVVYAIGVLFCTVIALGFAGSATLAQSENMRREQVLLNTSQGQTIITAEIADTALNQQRGLMFRRSLGPREGMLFLYERAEAVRMWMKNTFISLDMVFIQADGTVHRIERHTEPFSERIISSEAPVLGVLEINAGLSDTLGLRPGDKIIHQHFRAP